MQRARAEAQHPLDEHVLILDLQVAVDDGHDGTGVLDQSAQARRYHNNGDMMAAKVEVIRLPMTVKIDRQGRVVIPQRERERLGVGQGGTLELVSTAEGLLLEPRRHAIVAIDDDGLPLVKVDGLNTVSNDEAIDAIHRLRERA